ncbi:ABC-F family ATP-binding cassette domain-containing protein [Synechococcus elongatus]|uniref:ABC-F family ATP-binding cassette domain-containing protein n=1 Tax=Synechococcus elongatus PCC 11801 TaxID=2219813 RepID=A0AAN1QPY2_SYNEL|nr:ABC-F family ATP-binding cassette domain-containing protein [Synechococcus elongatus]AZB73358.1 ABC transporter ATP-binding protein [Synechococcus elongatus PCC 11801]
MALMTLRNVSKDYGLKVLLQSASFSVSDRDRIGLIGRNGSGKSTLLRILAGLETADSGDIQRQSGLRTVYVPQDPQLDPERTVLEQVFADAGEQLQLVRDYEAISEQLATAQGETAEALMARLTSLSQQLDAQDAWGLETQAKIVLSRLGIHNFQQRVGDLSGGYRKRLGLASALLADPELLLLDEPTNHLDADSVEWLQSFLSKFRGALVLITHDRYFLDRVTNRILDLDRGELSAYDGTYAYYLQKKAEQEAAAASSAHKFQGVLRRELAWLQRGPKARSTKQKARIQRIEEMRSQEGRAAAGRVEIAAASQRLGKTVVRLENVSKRFGDRQLIQNFSYEVSPEERLGIIGPNGVGKSTLLNLMTGQLAPDEGNVVQGSTVCFGYVDQQAEGLELAAQKQQRPIDYLREEGEYLPLGNGEKLSASQLLERFLFPPAQQYAPIAALSGGEKRRLYLLRILMTAPNVLILDEPTNDLDIQTLAVLEEYLEDFPGTVIVISHDRYFLDRTVDSILAFEPTGELRHYPGNYSVYLEYQQKQANSTEIESLKQLKSNAERSSNQPSRSQQRRLSFKEKRELEQLELQIPVWEAEKAEIESKLYQDGSGGFSQLQALSEQLAELENRIETGTERWLELSEVASAS